VTNRLNGWRCFFGVRVTTEDDYFVLDGDLDPLTERETSRRGVT